MSAAHAWRLAATAWIGGGRPILFALEVQAEGDRPTRRAEISVQVSAAAAPWRKIWSSSGVQGRGLFDVMAGRLEPELARQADLFRNGRPIRQGEPLELNKHVRREGGRDADQAAAGELPTLDAAWLGGDRADASTR